MKRSILLIAVIVICGCRQPQKEFLIPDNKEINSVLKAVISQRSVVVRYDSTGLVINRESDGALYNSLDSLPLSVDLVKVKVTSSESGWNMANVNELIDPKDPEHFSKTDTPYLFFQNDTLHNVQINKRLVSKTIFTSNAERKIEKDKGGRSTHFYEVSIPIFSRNQNQAFVQFNIYWRFELGGGYAFILKKIDGNWKIVRQWRTWMS